MSFQVFDLNRVVRRVPIKAANCMAAHNGSLWVGAANGLWKVTLSNFKSTKVAPDFITDIHLTNDAVWCTTWMDRGLIKVDKRGLRVLGSPTSLGDLTPKDVNRMNCVLSERNSIWVGTDAGLYRFDHQSGWSEAKIGSPVKTLVKHRDNRWCIVQQENGDFLTQIRNGDILLKQKLAISVDTPLRVFGDEIWCAGTSISGLPMLMQRRATSENPPAKYYTLSWIKRSAKGVVVSCNSLTIYRESVICGIGTVENSSHRPYRVKGGGLLTLDLKSSNVYRLPELNGENVTALVDCQSGLFVATGQEVVLFRRTK